VQGPAAGTVTSKYRGHPRSRPSSTPKQARIIRLLQIRQAVGRNTFAALHRTYTDGTSRTQPFSRARTPRPWQAYPELHCKACPTSGGEANASSLMHRQQKRYHHPTHTTPPHHNHPTTLTPPTNPPPAPPEKEKTGKPPTPQPPTPTPPPTTPHRLVILAHNVTGFLAALKPSTELVTTHSPSHMRRAATMQSPKATARFSCHRIQFTPTRRYNNAGRTTTLAPAYAYNQIATHSQPRSLGPHDQAPLTAIDCRRTQRLQQTPPGLIVLGRGNACAALSPAADSEVNPATVSGPQPTTGNGGLLGPQATKPSPAGHRLAHTKERPSTNTAQKVKIRKNQHDAPRIANAIQQSSQAQNNKKHKNAKAERNRPPPARA